MKMFKKIYILTLMAEENGDRRLLIASEDNEYLHEKIKEYKLMDISKYGAEVYRYDVYEMFLYDKAGQPIVETFSTEPELVTPDAAKNAYDGSVRP